METKRNYSIRRYSKNWPRRYQKQKNILKEILGSEIIETHHVGSTSVPGMKAKPIIDVLILIKELETIDTLEKKFEKLGYQLQVNYVAPKSRLLEKFAGGKKIYNIHFLPKNHPETHRMLNIKNYLLLHPRETKKYEQLKEQLYKKYPENYAAYRKGKTNFINLLQERANQWTKNKK